MRLPSNTTFLIAVLATVASCSSPTQPPPPPPPPPPPQLELSCPTALTREATSPQGTDVHFDAPIPVGGREPYSVQCEPGSSSIFALGETAVRCTATDAGMAQASCGFSVTVRASQTIAKTKFTAFGDSITDGKVSLVPLISLAGPDTYPFKLEQMLQQRYPSQTLLVVNQGVSGDDTRDGVRRLPSVLDSDRPEVLLLLMGVNTINALTTSAQASNLRTMITMAQWRGVDVIIATIMPVMPNARVYQSTTPAKVRALNAEIFELADRYNLGPPVDLFAIFEANPELMGTDGLHPSIEGQTRIAEAFRDDIVRRYQSGSTTTLRYSAVRRAR